MSENKTDTFTDDPLMISEEPLTTDQAEKLKELIKVFKTDLQEEKPLHSVPTAQ